MIVDGIVEPMELGHLPYKKGTYEDYVGRAGLERHGKKKWRRHVADVVARLIAALEPDETVIGGGNVKKLDAFRSIAALARTTMPSAADFGYGRKAPSLRQTARNDALEPSEKVPQMAARSRYLRPGPTGTLAAWRALADRHRAIQAGTCETCLRMTRHAASG